jgi:hypothetical protein
MKGTHMLTHHLDGAVWKKASRSNGNGGNNCVEVALVDDGVAVRDTKNPGTATVFNGPAVNATRSALGHEITEEYAFAR